MSAINDELMKAMKTFGERAPKLGQRQLALMADAHVRLFRQIEEMNEAWSESVRRTSNAEAEFARRLADCSDPAKAAELSTDWLSSCAATFLAESQRFAGLWLNFYSDSVKAAWTDTVKANAETDPGSAQKRASQ